MTHPATRDAGALPATSGDTIAPTAPTANLDWRLMLPVFVIVSLDAASSGAMLPILPFYLRELGATPLVLGIVLGAEALSQFAAAPWLGQLSDRFGRRNILLASQGVALVSLTLLGFAQSVVFVLLARVLLGLTAANFSAAAAYAADNSSVRHRRQAIGILSAGLGLGGIFGPSVSGLLSERSLQTPIWAALALTTTSMLVTGICLKRSGTPGQAGGKAIRSDKELGYLLTADGAINILVQLLVLGWLGRRFSERNLIVLVFGILSIGYLLAGTATSIGTLALAVVFISSGVALARPTFVAALSVHVPSERQGVVMGATQSLVALTDIVTPVIAGLLLGQSLYGAWVGSVIAIALTGAVVARVRLRPPAGEPAVSTVAS